jgi:tetratricopeptide (TPR) repeat protein
VLIDPDNPVIRLCLAGSQAEFEHRLDDAQRLYQQAWTIATDDYEACIAAHYVARYQTIPEETLRWNQIALDRAEAAGTDRVGEFFPSLYLNLGHSYEILGQHIEAQQYYDRAAELGVVHQAD